MNLYDESLLKFGRAYIRYRGASEEVEEALVYRPLDVDIVPACNNLEAFYRFRLI